MRFLRVVFAILKHPLFRVCAGLFILALLYFSGRLGLGNFRHIPGWGWVGVSFFLMLPPFLITAFRFRIVLSGVGMGCSFLKALSWTMIGYFWDVAMPSSSGGDFFKIVYLMDHFGERRGGMAILAVFLDRLIGLFGLLIFAFLACVLAYNRLTADPRLVWLPWILLGLTILGFLAYLLPLTARFRESSLRRKMIGLLPAPDKWEEIYQGYAKLGTRLPLLGGVLVLSILNHSFVVGSILTMALGLGIDLPMPAAITVIPISLFLNIFGFCGGFGAGEAAFEYLFAIFLGTAAGEGARLSLAFHVAFVLVRIFGLPFYLFSGKRKKPTELAAAKSTP